MRNPLCLLCWRVEETEGESPVRRPRKLRDHCCPRTQVQPSLQGWRGHDAWAAQEMLQRAELCLNFPWNFPWTSTLQLKCDLCTRHLGDVLAEEGLGVVRLGKLHESVGSMGWGWARRLGIDLVSADERSPMILAQCGRWLESPRIRVTGAGMGLGKAAWSCDGKKEEQNYCLA